MTPPNTPTAEERSGLAKIIRDTRDTPLGIADAIIAADWRLQPPERPKPEVGVEEIAEMIARGCHLEASEEVLVEQTAQAILSRLTEAAPPTMEG